LTVRTSIVKSSGEIRTARPIRTAGSAPDRIKRRTVVGETANCSAAFAMGNKRDIPRLPCAAHDAIDCILNCGLPPF
jgi:hypothetical protein